MKKRIFGLVLFLILTVSFLAPESVKCYADDQKVHDDRVVDKADLLNEVEEQELRAYLDRISEELQFEVVVVTTDSLAGKQPMDYADDFYDNHSYGYGASNDGVIFLRYIKGNEREVWISTCGLGITAIDDNYIDRIFDDVTSDVLSGNYYNAFLIYGEDVYIAVNEYKNTGNKVETKGNSGRTDYYHEDSWDTDGRNGYYFNINEYSSFEDYKRRAHGKSGLGTVFGYMSYRFSGQSEALLVRIGGGLLIGLVLALIVCGYYKKQLRSVAVKINANDFATPGGFRVNKREDIYIRTSVSKTSRESTTSSSSSSGGSSVHHSSSGVSHGGGGRHI